MSKKDNASNQALNRLKGLAGHYPERAGEIRADCATVHTRLVELRKKRPVPAPAKEVVVDNPKTVSALETAKVENKGLNQRVKTLLDKIDDLGAQLKAERSKTVEAKAVELGFPNGTAQALDAYCRMIKEETIARFGHEINARHLGSVVVAAASVFIERDLQEAGLSVSIQTPLDGILGTVPAEIADQVNE